MSDGAIHARGEMSTPPVTTGMGGRFHRWRDQRGIPRNRVHLATGISNTVLWRLETEEGYRISTLDAVERLAGYMGVSPAWLAWGEGGGNA